jgi:hypothetical protein
MDKKIVMTSIGMYEKKVLELFHMYANGDIDIREFLTTIHNFYYKVEEMHKQEILNAFSAGAEDGFDGLSDSDVELYYETLANGGDWSKVTLKMRDLFKKTTINQDWENSSGMYQNNNLKSNI